MVNTSPQHPTPIDSLSDIPPLESGDRLIRPEFERRYNAMPNLKKASDSASRLGAIHFDLTSIPLS